MKRGLEMSAIDGLPEELRPTRRELLHRCGVGMGALGLAAVLGDAGLLAAPGVHTPGAPGVNRLTPKKPHFPGKVRRVLHIFLNGGPSHVDTFDPKPALAKFAGKTLPIPNLRTERRTGAAFPSPFTFEKY